MYVVRRVAVVVAAASAVTSLAVMGTGAAVADTQTTYDATGSATGMKMTMQNQTIPAGIVIEGSGPTAQAQLSSLGTSNAFAALPYPGDTAANITGTVTALTQVPLPDYPLYVHSSNGDHTDPVDFPGIELGAETSGYRSAARAVAGTSAMGYFADSVVQQDSDGTVAVRSVAQQNGIDVGGKLTVSGVISKATAELLGNGKTRLKASMIIGRLYAPGLKFTVPAQFCIPTQPCQSIPAPFAGQVINAPDIGFADGTFYLTLPIAGPQRFPVPAQSVFDAFKAIGVDMKYQAAIATKTSIVAPNLSMNTVLPSPPNNPGFNGPTPVTYTFGTTSASLTGSISDSGFSLGDFPVFTPGGTDTGAPIGPTDGAALPLDLGTGSTQGLSSDVGSSVPPAVTGDGQGTAGAPPLVAVSVRHPFKGNVAWFYLVFIGVAVAGSAAGQILRYVGVRAS